MGLGADNVGNVSGEIDAAALDRAIRLLEALEPPALRIPLTLQTVILLGPMRCALWMLSAKRPEE